MIRTTLLTRIVVLTSIATTPVLASECPPNYQLDSDGWCRPIASASTMTRHSSQSQTTQASRPIAPLSTASGTLPPSFMADDYGSPVYDQGTSSSCYIFASTALFENLVNKLRARRLGRNAQKLTLNGWNYLRSAIGSYGGFNQFTDQPYLFKRNGMADQYGVGDFQKEVLFSRSQGGPWANGGMSQAELTLMKKKMIEHNSPILFTWKHPSRSYWHTNLCYGYDDTRQVLFCRDSAFGKQDASGKRNFYEMPYSIALGAGKHAASYFLPGDGPQAAQSRSVAQQNPVVAPRSAAHHNPVVTSPSSGQTTTTPLLTMFDPKLKLFNLPLITPTM